MANLYYRLNIMTTKNALKKLRRVRRRTQRLLYLDAKKGYKKRR